jgi:exo-1,4-beta-D-glucosaminidase
MTTKGRPRRLLTLALGVMPLLGRSNLAGAAPGTRVTLAEGWRLQSSVKAAATGDVLSQPGLDASGWYAISVPNTVVGALVENGTYPDPYSGMNLRSIPGTTYPIGERFSLIPTPADSPFKPSWWYRTEFDLAAGLAGRSVLLRFDGINYRANIWLNGTRVADSRKVVGAFRRYELDVTPFVRTGGKNALAVEVTGPEPGDLGIMWVDWNPTPADKNMGLWGGVSLSDSGPVALRHPHVVSSLDLPSVASARLAVSAELWNTRERAANALLRGAIEGVRFEKRVLLAPKERLTVRFTPAEFPQLRFASPRLWWPHRMGAPELYKLAMEVEVDGTLSDRQETRFGIQQMTSELTPEGHRRFRVNGNPILIRGGGWASDMLLRPAPRSRLEAELRYTKEMGLNTVRLEGKLESDEFYDVADELGLLIMPGWCCCDQWEKWDKWDAEDHEVGPACLRDQILRLRNHPSVLVWLNGSDFPPPAKVEKAYLDVLAELDWARPILSSATEAPGPVSGPSGVKMRGPYDYVPPSYWLTDVKNGGAFGFATEVGPGGAVPPIESLKQMLPADRLWPINDVWRFHAGGDEFKDLRRFTEALEARYGPATDATDYARKAQALAYEGQRAMFEAFGRNKYKATGVIQWMLNNAWPSMIWHLYDYYLRPGGGYFGTKKACEPVHVQYSYDDRSVVVVNDLRESFKGLRVSAQVLDLGLASLFRGDAVVDVEGDGVRRALDVPKPPEATTTYLLRLALADSSGRPLGENLYWLSTREDVLDWPKTEWYYTPTKRHADLTALGKLPATSLKVSVEHGAGGTEGRERVRIENTGKALAFQVRLRLTDGPGGPEILPAFWDDNYLAVLPGEVRSVGVTYRRSDAKRGRPAIEVEGWNVEKTAAD